MNVYNLISISYRLSGVSARIIKYSVFRNVYVTVINKCVVWYIDSRVSEGPLTSITRTKKILHRNRGTYIPE